MGWGSWDAQAYSTYTTNTRGMDSATFATADNFTAQTMFTSRRIADALNPKDVMRECCDSEEHPNTLPVILALDVTGSMGGAAMKVAQKLNEIMTDLYADNGVKDIEFCVMGIGDLECDNAPVQISQFESDIRIAEQLDKVYFEAGGGGNTFESYTAAWYMGARHCKLDCWNRGQKGIIITMGDECPNPYLPKRGLAEVTGDRLQDSIETKDLLDEVKEKWDVYHISINDRESSYEWHNKRYHEDEQWRKLLGDNYHISTLDNLAQTITNIIIGRVNSVSFGNSNEVTW